MLGDFFAEATSKSARFLGFNFFDLGQFNPDSAAHKQQRKGNSSLKNQSIRLFHGGALLVVSRGEDDGGAGKAMIGVSPVNAVHELGEEALVVVADAGEPL
jgi:hypothetical protein